MFFCICVLYFIDFEFAVLCFFGAQSKAVAGDVTDNSVFLFVFVFCILLILNLLFCVF